MRNAATLGLAAAILTLAACSTKSSSSASGSTAASSSASSSGSASGAGALGTGVTATAIRLGITYVDLAAIRNLVNIDHGDYKTAYTTVIKDVNAHGGVNGRKIVPYFAPVNPIGSDPAAQACTQLTEDDQVFAVIGFFQNDDPLCYVETHDTPIIGASLTAQQQQRAKATWFNYQLSDDHLIPRAIDAFAKQNVFAGHKVAVVGQAPDQPALQNLVVPELKKLGVDVVQTAIEDAPTTDTAAGYQQYALIAQKFQSSGADVVVAVGNAGTGWPKALQVNHSTYLPRLVATSYNSLAAYVADKAGDDPAVMRNAITADGSAPDNIVWNDPAMQRCVALIQAAEPAQPINNPITATGSTPNTWVSPIAACQNVTLFVDIAKAAGATLNEGTFLQGGESLTSVTIPGSGGPLHFGPGGHDGGGPVFLSTWDPNTKALVYASTAG